eukprot:Seg984.11 transcript_id=Seg984.11/GoldUCD/mRNA.D3Y31 product="Thioredoxin domain-containing protein 5" protein_id=Seg984.11/GoldUCD/D3Y31
MASGLRSFEKLFSCLIFILPAFSEHVEAPIYTQSEFVSYVPDTPHFIMFFAPWCSHCHRMIQLWNKLATYYTKNNVAAIAAKVDCTVDTPLCAQEDIKAYPTLRFFNYGLKATYRGTRDLSEFIRFTTKQLLSGMNTDPETGEVALELDTYSLEKELRTGLKLINFYAPWCSHCQRLAPTWKLLAEEYRYSTGVRILKVNCELEKEICKKYEIKGFPTIFTFNDGIKTVKYQGDRSLDNLKWFVNDMIQKYVHNEEIDLQNTTPPPGDTDTSAMDGTNDQTEPPMDVPLTNEPTGDEVVPDEAEPIEAPETADDEAIPLTKATFDMAVNNGKTFVYFFAPWCKYCREFAPVWNELAKKVIEQGIMVKIAKVDCTKEEELCQELKITAYPHLRLFKSRLNSQEYIGNRNLEELLRFIKIHEHDEL